MKKLTIKQNVTLSKQNVTLSAYVENGSKLLDSSPGWVTWYRKSGDAGFVITTCPVVNFETQDRNEQIQLSCKEILDLVEKEKLYDK